MANVEFGNLKHPIESFRGTDTGAGMSSLIKSLISLATYGAGIALLGMFIYGGISWATAQGNEEQVERAQKILSNAVIGMVIVVAALIVTQIIGTVLGIENILTPSFPGPTT